MKHTAALALALALFSALPRPVGAVLQTAPSAFAPAADTRLVPFSRDSASGYASLYAATAFPGEILVWPAAQSPTPLTLRVEVLPFEKEKCGIPKLPAGDHFDANPRLPFNPPEPSFPHAVFTTTVNFPANAEPPLHAPFHLPYYYSYYTFFARIRWTLLDAAGAVLAQDFLPDAFAHIRDWPTGPHATLVAPPLTMEEAQDQKNTFIAATEDSPRAWPFLSHSISAIDFRPAGAAPSPSANSRPVGAALQAAPSFVGRARLLGIDILPETNASSLPVFPLCTQNSYGRYDSSPAAFARQPPGEEPSRVWNGKWDAAGNERLMGAARIPGDALGRNTGAYFAATVIFLILFFLGTAILLARYFARRKGEARLRVWVALPAWCVAATLFVLFVLPLFLDRVPRADIIQWRLSTPGEPEAFVLETGRAQAFTRAPVSWRFPADGWFSGDDYAAGGAANYDLAAGTLILRDPPRPVGKREEVMAMRFAPAPDPPFSITPDEEVRQFRFATRDGEAGGFAILEDLAASVTHPPRAISDRAVTAHGDFAAVWLFARGKWYSLGPMKDGETRAPDASMFVQEGLAIRRTPFCNLFEKAPFALATGRISDAAESWLAKKAEENAEGGEPLAGLDYAVIVALRAEENPPVKLAPLFATRRAPVITTRIVEVEAFQ